MNSGNHPKQKTAVLESNTINAIPESARHGKPSSQFTLWLSANLQITAVVDGGRFSRIRTMSAYTMWVPSGLLGLMSTTMSGCSA